jgi:regulator of ribonuclease activity A
MVRMACVSALISTRVFFKDTSMPQTSAISFSTCDFCDANKSNDSGDFRVIPTVFQNYGARHQFAGPVLTVKCYEDNSHVKQAVETEGRGRVLVVDGGASVRRALLGGNLAASAQRNGWAGIVIDGCARDAAELAVLDMGIRALALNPMPTDRAGQGQTGLTIHIQGVQVNTGDWLYADQDGIVISTTALHLVS